MFSLFDRLRYFRFVRFCLPLRRLYNCNDTGENKKTGKSYQYEYGTYFQAVFLRIRFIRHFIVSHPHGHGKNAIHQPQKKKVKLSQILILNRNARIMNTHPIMKKDLYQVSMSKEGLLLLFILKTFLLYEQE